jgi:hypothetical protein
VVAGVAVVVGATVVVAATVVVGAAVVVEVDAVVFELPPQAATNRTATNIPTRPMNPSLSPNSMRGRGDTGALGVFEPGATAVVADQTLEERVEAVEMEMAAIYAEIESLNSRMA